MGQPSKKQRLNTEPSYEWVQAIPGDLHIATAVLYESDTGPRRGVIYDAFEPVDHYWVEDEETCEVVRNDAGDCHDFNSGDLKVVKAKVDLPSAPAARVPEHYDSRELPRAGVLLIGSEMQISKILQHFHEINAEAPPPEQWFSSSTRSTIPQQLLSIPCCDSVNNLAQHASDGIDEGLKELAQQLRMDIQVALRVAHLKQVTQKLGEEILTLKDYFCLASVHLPLSWTSIPELEPEEARRRDALWNQIDVCITAFGEGDPEHSSLDAARVVLGEHCCLEISDALWKSEVQSRIRGHLQVKSLPLSFKDPMDTEVFPLLLPKDAVVTCIKGVLCFGEAPDAWYLTQDAPAETAGPQQVHNRQHKTVRDWEALQDEFAELPPVPAPWIRVRSRSNGQVYYYNKDTNASSFKLPTAPPAAPVPAPVPVPPAPAATQNSNGLPPGWTQHRSKTNGKIYYFHEASNKSQYVVPRAG